MVGRCISYWNGHFWGDMLVFRGVPLVPNICYLQIPFLVSEICTPKLRNPADWFLSLTEDFFRPKMLVGSTAHMVKLVLHGVTFKTVLWCNYSYINICVCNYCIGNTAYLHSFRIFRVDFKDDRFHRCHSERSLQSIISECLMAKKLFRYIIPTY